MTVFRTLQLPSPLGSLRAEATDEGLIALAFGAAGAAATDQAPAAGEVAAGGAAHDHLDRLEAELLEYLAGRLRRFTVPLRPAGTEFQVRVWEALTLLPYGRTCSYAALTDHLALPAGAARAVGQANGRNPIAILIPCHRVVQRGGGLGGYGGGLERKAWLLAHERRHAPAEGQASDPAETWSGQLRLGW